MESEGNDVIVKNPALYHFISTTVSIMVIVIGCVVLAGWLFDLTAVQTVLPGLPKMVPNTAISFILAGISLWLYSITSGSTPYHNRWSLVAQVLAILVVLIDVLTLSEYLLGRDLGIDQLLFMDPVGAQITSIPGRSSPQTALAFTLTGISLIVLKVEKPRRYWFVQCLILTAAFIVLLALVGYGFGFSFLYRISLYTGMALHTALAMLMLCIGILFLHPNQGFMALIIDDNLGGVMARRLLFAAIIVPLVVGWLSIIGERVGLYGSVFEPVLLAVLSIYVYSIVIWWYTNSLSRIDTARREAEKSFRLVVEANLDAIVVVDQRGEIALVNAQTEKMFGYHRDELVGQPLEILLPDRFRSVHTKHRANYFANLRTRFMGQQELYLAGKHKAGHEIPVEIGLSFIKSGADMLAVSFITDISERAKFEKALRYSENLLREAQRMAHLGSWEMDIATGKSAWSDEFYRICGYEPGAVEASAETRFQIIHPDDREAATTAVQQAIDEDKPYHIEKRIVRPNQEVRHVLSQGEVIYDENSNPLKLIGTFLDITERKQAEEALARSAEELRRSNTELEHFAYVASHDLQEPLRMVTSYLQLLERRYRDKLDDDAQEFIDYAVDGANRMKQLINDLLTYSRVGTRGKPFEPTDCEAVLKQVLYNLELTIADNQAVITHDPLPTVLADDSQLLQLFQNLISNALKYRSKTSPKVAIGAKLQGDEWLFSVSDNGIGIEPEFSKQVFVIFHRLHRQDEYSGTGIGLATCKKIVERHSGRIWVESEPGQGATFYFTIPNLTKMDN